jgi:hypothetical protein
VTLLTQVALCGGAFTRQQFAPLRPYYITIHEQYQSLSTQHSVCVLSAVGRYLKCGTTTRSLKSAAPPLCPSLTTHGSPAVRTVEFTARSLHDIRLVVQTEP